MKNANRFLTLATFLSICFCSMLNGQERREIITGEDTVISTPFFTASAGWTLPFGEMGNRYDPFININTNFQNILFWKFFIL
jgi:hypothetical protein